MASPHMPPGANIKHCHKSENGNSDRVPSSRNALSVIRSLKSDIKIMKVSSGLHEYEMEKYRRELWDITSAKLYALNLAEAAILELPPERTESDELLFQKLNWKLFGEYLYERAASHRREGILYGNKGLREVSDDFHIRARELELALKAFNDLGNAGEQPKDKENGAQPMGNPPVTVAPQFCELLQVIPGKCFELSADDLTRISDWCLDMLENMNAASRWAPSVRGGEVGEGDMPDAD